MVKTRKPLGISAIIGLMVVFVALVGAGIFGYTKFFGSIAGDEGDTGDAGDLAVGEGDRYSAVTFAVDATEADSANQDDEADVGIDFFKWNPTVQAKLADKEIIDCSMNPDGESQATYKNYWDGSSRNFEIEHFCAINYYDFWKGFTAGDEEVKLASLADAEAVSGCTDKSTVAGAGAINSTSTCTLSAGECFLVTMNENADSDEEDVIPTAFVVCMPERTKLNVEQIEAGGIDITGSFRYNGEAITSGQTKLDGVCDDSEDNAIDIGSSLNGVVDSSLTSATTSWTADCDVTIELKKDGYKMIVLNPISSDDTEKGYMKVDTWGFNATTADNGLASVAVSGGSVAYDVTDFTDGILHASMSVCGIAISDNSGSDALSDDANDKLYDVSCMKNIVYGEKITIPIKVGSTTVFYQSANYSDTTLSTAEQLIDLSLIGIESTTDAIGQNLTA